MTIGERAAACVGELDAWSIHNWEAIIARHIREAVAERDKLLAECLTWLRHCNVGDSCQEQITAMIGEQA